MKELKQVLDISALPNSAQKEIFDFFQFLKQRYHTKKKIAKFTFLDSPIKVDSIVTLSREKIHER